MEFTAPGYAWIPVLRGRDLIPQLSFIAGSALILPVIAVWVAVWSLFRLKSLRRGLAAPAFDAPKVAWIVAACSIIAVVLSLGLGFWRSMLVDRYLTPFVPGVLLSLALLASRFAQDWRLAPDILVSVSFAVLALLCSAGDQGIHKFNFQTASEALAAEHPSRLEFLWDSPTKPDASALRSLGEFFFRRAGQTVAVAPVYLDHDQDPNTVLLNRATQPGTAILWLYDLTVKGTATLRYPPAISRRDPRWRCSNFGGGPFGVIACSRAT
jgi:hypothetical protein